MSRHAYVAHPTEKVKQKRKKEERKAKQTCSAEQFAKPCLS